MSKPLFCAIFVQLARIRPEKGSYYFTRFPSANWTKTFFHLCQNSGSKWRPREGGSNFNDARISSDPAKLMGIDFFAESRLVYFGRLIDFRCRLLRRFFGFRRRKKERFSLFTGNSIVRKTFTQRRQQTENSFVTKVTKIVLVKRRKLQFPPFFPPPNSQGFRLVIVKALITFARLRPLWKRRLYEAVTTEENFSSFSIRHLFLLDSEENFHPLLLLLWRTRGWFIQLVPSSSRKKSDCLRRKDKKTKVGRSVGRSMISFLVVSELPWLLWQ